MTYYCGVCHKNTNFIYSHTSGKTEYYKCEKCGFTISFVVR